MIVLQSPVRTVAAEHDSVRLISDYMDQRNINFLKPQLSHSDFESNSEKKPRTKLIMGLLGIAILGFLFLRTYNMSRWPTNPADYDPVTLRPKKAGFFQSVKNYIFNSEQVMKGQDKDRINILLLGIGGYGHDGPFLSDTNIIVSIKPSTNHVAMISIPRDLAVKIDKHGWRKINHANAFGEAEQPGNGGEYARKIFESTLGIEIPYYVRVDFKAFKEIIDIIGGITVEVKRPFTDYAYPGSNFSYQTVSFEAGQQTMNGERALIFARSRHGSNGEGSDFARALRQQMVLVALREKVLSAGTYLNPVRIQKIISSLSTNITTNLDFGQIMYLISMGKQMDKDVKTLVIDDSPNGFLRSFVSESGAYLLGPRTGNFEEVRNAITNVFSSSYTIVSLTTPESATSSAATLEIQNGTWQLGLANKTRQALEAHGFVVIATGNSPRRPLATTTIYLVNQRAPRETVAMLEARFKTKPISQLPEWLQTTYNDPATTVDETGPKYNPGADILIIVGEDAA